jgi:hypothetical protein
VFRFFSRLKRGEKKGSDEDERKKLLQKISFAHLHHYFSDSGKKARYMVYFEHAGLLLSEEDTMEQTPRVGSGEFTEQFVAILQTHWSEIIQVLNRQSPRIAALLQVSCPSGMKRINGGWQIQVVVRRMEQPQRLRQPRDNEIVAHAIRSWAHSAAQLELPPVTVKFEA